MKKGLFILLIAAISSQGIANQVDFNFGRGTPQSSIQAGGSSERAGSRGTNWSADYLYRMNPVSSVGLGGGQFRSNDHVSETFVSNTSSTISSKTTSILLLTRAEIPSRSRIQPYVIAGIGWARNSLLITDRTGAGTLLDQTRDALSFATGIGLDYPISDGLVIGIEGRYQGSTKQTYSLTPAGQALTGTTSVDTSLNVFILGVKVGVKY